MIIQELNIDSVRDSIRRASERELKGLFVQLLSFGIYKWFAYDEMIKHLLKQAYYSQVYCVDPPIVYVLSIVSA